MALLLGACAGEKNDTDDDPTEVTVGTTTTAGESATSTEGATEPTTTESPTTPATTADSESTSPGETSTGAGEPEATTCEKYCVMLAKCVGLTPEEAQTCPQDCEADLADLEGECLAAATASFECHAGLTCSQVEDLEQGNEGPCTDEGIAQEDVCGFGNVCTIGGGGDGEPSTCEFSRECAGEPLMVMRCTEAACECFEDEVKFGMCASEPICNDFVQLEAKALSCCGIGG
ncbi:hypothetical protein [Nannocystis punicea]|uniref:Uncharacterized protein n=1 Tax=Nannocystis punicea TaxID=2995304 RepID=A0ABY7GSA5_9BACT|nr:hypothetical protein [Nannocystis poenicansa]WAS89823.1 hypothetical protein O0S08_26830 [Nannocystis poenicansa]